MIQKSSHITDEQLAAILAGEPESSAGQHLTECALCSAEYDHMRKLLAAMRTEVAALAAEPVQMPKPEAAFLRARLAWFPSAPALAATATLLVLAALLLLVPRTQAPLTASSSAPSFAASQWSDADVLAAAESALAAPVPASLNPAALIAQELLATTPQPRPKKVSKEKRNEL